MGNIDCRACTKKEQNKETVEFVIYKFFILER
jgi:hypothetical protein